MTDTDDRPEDRERGEAMPCPFCGRDIGEADTRVGRQFDREHEYYIVVCPACGACGPEAATEDGALASWNLTPRLRTGAGEDVTDAARLALRWFKTWGADRHGPKLDSRSVVAVLEDALGDRPDPSTRSEREECICGRGFGMNLSCPVHSTHADPAPTESEEEDGRAYEEATDDWLADQVEGFADEAEAGWYGDTEPEDHEKLHEAARRLRGRGEETD